MFSDHGLGGLLEEGAHGKSPKCLGGNLGDLGEFCKGLRLYLLGKMMNEQDQVEIFESLLQQTVDRLFDKYDGNFDRLDKQEQELVYIWRAEADIYNGGMLQFLCNWGFSAAETTCDILEKMKANRSAALIRQALETVTSEVQRVQKEGKVLKETWDIPKYLSLESENLLEDLDEQYWEDPDNLCQKGWQHYLS